jgi:ATP/maltotriose-dependent transcriptional regulator MalT
MGDIDVLVRIGWSYGPAFDLVAPRLRRPLLRPGTVRRSSLIARLARDAGPIVSVAAPAGYGKTTLLSQWAERDGRAFAWVSSLTTAELRILPLLATHLSFPEIAGELFVSRHTVRSQAMSVYRKLGASSRSQAVARARELGLLEE